MPVNPQSGDLWGSNTTTETTEGSEPIWKMTACLSSGHVRRITCTPQRQSVAVPCGNSGCSRESKKSRAPRRQNEVKSNQDALKTTGTAHEGEMCAVGAGVQDERVRKVHLAGWRDKIDRPEQLVLDSGAIDHPVVNEFLRVHKICTVPTIVQAACEPLFTRPAPLVKHGLSASHPRSCSTSQVHTWCCVDKTQDSTRGSAHLRASKRDGSVPTRTIGASMIWEPQKQSRLD